MAGKVKISDLSREERERKWGWVRAEVNGPELHAMSRVMIEHGVGWVEASRRVRAQQQERRDA